MGLSLTGVNGISGLNKAVNQGVELSTEGLAGGTIWTPGQGYFTLSGVTSFALRIDLNYTQGIEGLVWEAGGWTFGSIAYLKNGFFYIKSGGATGSGASPAESDANNLRLELPALIGNNTYEASFRSGEARAWINGIEQSIPAHSWSAERLVGNNAGGLEQIWDTDSSTGGLQQRAGMEPGTPESLLGAVSYCEVWPNVYIN